MKNLTSLILVGMVCFLGISLTGCGGPQENTVIESTAPANETGGFESQEQMDQYAAEMAKARNPGAQGGEAAPAE